MKFLFGVFLMFVFNLLYASQQRLEISTDYVDGTCSEYFSMLKFEFTNNSNEWIQLSNVNVDFGDDVANQQVKILTGQKLGSWVEANKVEQNRANIKTNLILGVVAGLSGVAMKSNHTTTQNLGKMGAFSVLGVITARSIASIEDKYRGDIFPSGHILNNDIVVPPGLSIQRWILLNTDNKVGDKYIEYLTITYLENGRPHSKKFPIRSYLDKYNISFCSWQSKLPHYEAREYLND